MVELFYNERHRVIVSDHWVMRKDGKTAGRYQNARFDQLIAQEREIWFSVSGGGVLVVSGDVKSGFDLLALVGVVYSWRLALAGQQEGI